MTDNPLPRRPAAPGAVIAGAGAAAELPRYDGRTCRHHHRDRPGTEAVEGQAEIGPGPRHPRPCRSGLGRISGAPRTGPSRRRRRSTPYSRRIASVFLFGRGRLPPVSIMMGLEEQLLTASIADTFGEAHKAAHNLYSLMERSTPDNVDHGHHADKLREADEILEFYIDKAFRDVAILAERLGLPLLRREIAKSRAAFEHLSELEVPARYDLFQSEPLDEARKFFVSLECMTRGRAVTGLGVFETVLQNTPKIIRTSFPAMKRRSAARSWRSSDSVSVMSSARYQFPRTLRFTNLTSG